MSCDFHSSALNFQNDQNILVLSNSGGGGHDSAANAVIKKFEKSQNQQFSSKKVDVIKGSFPGKIGSFVSRQVSKGWNKAKRDGDIEKQEFLVKGRPFRKFGPTNQRCADIIFFLPIFVATLIRLLRDKKITRIIDTQPIGTSAIIKAARLVNKIFRRNIKVTMVMTDLPTTDAIHFSIPIKRLSKNDKKIFDLVTTAPLIENGLAEKEWWKEVFGLDFSCREDSQVKYAPFPLRPAFVERPKSLDLPVSHHLQVKINNEEEGEYISNILEDKQLKPPRNLYNHTFSTKQIVKFDIQDQDFLGMVTIGSQAAEKTKDYVSDFIQLLREKIDKEDSFRDYYLFVACGKHEVGKKTLFKDVYDFAKVAIPEDLKSRIKVVPMGYQDDDELAQLMQRADFGVYGAGGLTTMEVLNTAKGEVYLHSEKKLDYEGVSEKDTQGALLSGFAVWERGNARYQIAKNQAKITIPGSIFKKKLNALIDIPK